MTKIDNNFESNEKCETEIEYDKNRCDVYTEELFKNEKFVKEYIADLNRQIIEREDEVNSAQDYFKYVKSQTTEFMDYLQTLDFIKNKNLTNFVQNIDWFSNNYTTNLGVIEEVIKTIEISYKYRNKSEIKVTPLKAEIKNTPLLGKISDSLVKISHKSIHSPTAKRYVKDDKDHHDTSYNDIPVHISLDKSIHF